MEVYINGERREIPTALTFAELIDHLGLTGGRVAVEVNRELLPRPLHASRKVACGDRVEIVPCRRMSRTKSWRLLRIVRRGDASVTPAAEGGSVP